ncbi:MAG TPA: SusC/RagA family TonB-linked outer membrane protein [Gemmatimonadaceae bacterium]|nr:SusC/RagA family TonB-linked outer membrane protein [Gemmatimonadaceae bacterium]
MNYSTLEVCTMTVQTVVRWFGAAAAGLALLASAGVAHAQNAVINGQVSSEVGEPLEGANVYVQELGLSAITNGQGRYTINVPAARATGQNVMLRVRYIGHVPQARQITLTAGQTQAQNFTLKVDVNRLQEVVVTGVTAATTQANLPFTVSKVSAADMPVPAQNPLTQLQGKVTGANIVSANGRPGSAPQVLLRGPKSINGEGRGQGPLYIVDGVAINGNLPDLNPQDIESVEIVKGAAAASLYGSRAGNGVIQITTKRGRAGDGIEFSVRGEAGVGDIEREFPLPTSHTMMLDETGKRFCVDVSGNATGSCVRTVDFEEEALRINEQATSEQSLPPAVFTNDFGIARTPGKQQLRGVFQANEWPRRYNPMAQAVKQNQFYTTNVDMTGRFGGTSVFASIGQNYQGGAFEYLDGYKRNTFRVNADQQIGDQLRLALSSFYSRSTAGSTQVDEGGTGFFRLTRVPAGVDMTRTDKFGRLFVRSNPLQQGAQNSNPLYLFQNEHQTNKYDRFIGSINGRYTPLGWLTIEGNFGYDRQSLNLQFLRDRGFRISQASATLPTGYIYEENGRTEAYNASLNASVSKMFGDLDTRWTAQYLYEQQDAVGMDLGGNGLVVPGLSTATAATTNFAINSSRQSIRATGLLASWAGTYKDRYIVDALIRRDGSSLFGSDNRWATYGRGSLAWRASQEAWWPFKDAVNEAKLRASMGSAGGRPRFSAQYETFTIGAGGVLTPATAGNSKLRPETTTEQEYGADFEFFNRVGLNVTYAMSNTEDQILLVPSPAITGFENQWQNAGTLQNKTWELSLNVPIITKPNFTYSTRINWDRNRTYITKLSVPPFFAGLGNLQQGAEQIFRFAEGERYGTLYGRKFVSNCSQLPSDFQSRCGDGKEFQRNDEGLIVWVGNASCGGQPCTQRDGIKYNLWQSVLPEGAAPWGVELSWGNGIIIRDDDGNAIQNPLGNTMPDFRWSVSQTMTWRKFSAYALVDAAVGQEVWNEGRHWSFGDFQTADSDQRGKTVETAKPIGHYWRAQKDHPAGVGGFYDILGPNSVSVEHASYAKLREVSLSYNVGPLFRTGDWTISMIGRNLHTFTNYTGFDPETGRSGGIVGSGAVNGVDAYQYPNIRTFTFSLATRF